MNTVIEREQTLAPAELRSARRLRTTSHEEIAEKAYDLWVLSHNADGCALENWLKAEKLLLQVAAE